MFNSIPNVVVYTVSDISSNIRNIIEKNFCHVCVRGEISGYRGPHSSGHAYFTLKDKDLSSKIEAVIWRSKMSKLKFKPEEGIEVLATGHITTFAGNSKYQIIIEELEAAGVGILLALLEKRKQQLSQEGLFKPDNKLKIPFLPKVIGIITSETGAVLQDIIHRLLHRCPVHVLVWPVMVQGSKSATDIVNAIHGFNEFPVIQSNQIPFIPKPDVLIIARGGGSLEDLWSFNEEVVARAASTSTIPIISAIGHETDWTILDLVADLRAPTPTGAAEMVVPVRAELHEKVTSLNSRIKGSIDRYLMRQRAESRSFTHTLPNCRDVFGAFQQKIDMISPRLHQGLMIRYKNAEKLAAVWGRTSPTAIAHRIKTAKQQCHTLLVRLSQAISNLIRRHREAQLAKIMIALSKYSPIETVRDSFKHLDVVEDRLNTTWHEWIRRKRTYLESRAELVESMSCLRVLKRGFVIVQSATNEVVVSCSSLKIGDKVSLNFQDGTTSAIVADAALTKNPLTSN